MWVCWRNWVFPPKNIFLFQTDDKPLIILLVKSPLPREKQTIMRVCPKIMLNRNPIIISYILIVNISYLDSQYILKVHDLHHSNPLMDWFIKFIYGKTYTGKPWFLYQFWGFPVNFPIQISPAGRSLRLGLGTSRCRCGRRRGPPEVKKGLSYDHMVIVMVIFHDFPWQSCKIV